jgi:hypothetical protein
LIFIKVSGLLSRSGWQSFSAYQADVFRSCSPLFLTLSASSCLPPRAYSHNGDTWVSCPHFSPLSSALQLFAS